MPKAKEFQVVKFHCPDCGKLLHTEDISNLDRTAKRTVRRRPTCPKCNLVVEITGFIHYDVLNSANLKAYITYQRR